MESILHPLVLINISDHLTRELSKRKGGQQFVVLGGILGTLDGRQLVIINSFEIALLPAPEGQQLSLLPDWDFFQLRLGQYHEVFPTLELVGWYIAGPIELTSIIRRFWEDASRFSDSSYVLSVTISSQLNSPPPKRGPCSQSASAPCPKPIKVPHMSIKLFDKIPTTPLDLPLLKELQFKLESGEAERICLSHVMSQAVRSSAVSTHQLDSRNAVSPSSGLISQLMGYLDSWGDAAEELKNRIEEAIKFLSEESTTGMTHRPELLSELSSICHAIERERNVNGEQDKDFELSMLSQLALSECSTLTASTATSLRKLLELKSELSRSSPWSAMDVEQVADPARFSQFAFDDELSWDRL